LRNKLDEIPHELIEIFNKSLTIATVPTTPI